MQDGRKHTPQAFGGTGMARDLIPQGYAELLAHLKQRIHEAQVRAALSVNRELVLLYWQIGREILQRQGQEGWGAKVIDRLARDLRAAFPEMKGFSPRNLKYMRALAATYPDEHFVQREVAQLPWAHNVILLDKVKDSNIRSWYAHAAVQYGWSRDILAHQIESRLYQRQGQAVTNFERTLPAPRSDLVQQMLKDPYNFDFLSLGKEAHERDLEQALLAHMRDFLLELGVGFAFVGSQYHLEVGGEDFYIDLLFYHLRLRCFVVIDLKVVDFAPEFAGKMNFYLAAVDDLLRHADDQPSIGIILCKTQNRTIAEYALRDMNAPLGVASYLTAALPEALKGSLPEIEELEATLADTLVSTDEAQVERNEKAETKEPTGGAS
jgi:predicted nuclease of restriction endonuclease-like (RecB) superfamily